MEHLKLEQKHIDKYLAFFDTESRNDHTASSMVVDSKGNHLIDQNRSCYANLPAHIHMGMDQFGVLYNGYVYGIPITWSKIDTVQKNVPLHSVVKGYGKGAKEWLAYLLSVPAFQDVLPFLKFVNCDTILKHKGFIFHDLKQGANLDLVWTFLSAARTISENPRILQHWLNLLTWKVPKDEAAFICMTMAPSVYLYDRTQMEHVEWAETHFGHCNVFGDSSHGTPSLRHFERYLSGKTLPSRPGGNSNFYDNQQVFRGERQLVPGTIKSMLAQMKVQDAKIEVSAAA